MAKVIERGIGLTCELEGKCTRRLNDTCFEPVMEVFKPLAKLRYEAENNHLLLTKGSIIRLPEKVYSTRAEYHLYRYIEYRIMTLYRRGELKDIGNREYKVVGRVSSISPTLLAIYVKGETVSGWDFFEGLEKVQDALFE